MVFDPPLETAVAEHTDFSSEVAELALAHAISNRVEAAYRRGNLLLKRRALMKRWEEFFTSPKKEGALVQLNSLVSLQQQIQP